MKTLRWLGERTELFFSAAWAALAILVYQHAKAAMILVLYPALQHIYSYLAHREARFYRALYDTERRVTDALFEGRLDDAQKLIKAQIKFLKDF